MPLATLSLDVNLQWQFARTNTGFGDTDQGVDSLDFNLGAISLSTFNQLAPQQVTIAPGAKFTLDLTALQNLVYEAFGLGHALSLFILPVGAPVKIAPGASNPLVWFFGASTQWVTIPDGGLILYSEPVTGPGSPVSGAAKTLDFTNVGTGTLTLTLAVLGSTT